ncbi:MAG: hypothetical protein AAGI52_04470 [Bacteroidota bacterium]
MRALLLVLALLAATASAASQPVPARMPASESAHMIGAGWGAASGVFLISVALEEPVVFALAPLASGLAVYATGEGYAREGSFAGAMAGAAAGALAGVTVIALSAPGPELEGGSLIGILAGGALYAMAPSITGTIGYNLGRLAVLRTPDGTLVPGATLRIAL